MLDYDGNVVAVESRKNWTPDAFIQSLSVFNEHERDALAAALKAFRSLNNKFKLVDKKSREAGIPQSRLALLKRLVLKGTTVEGALKAVKLMA